MREFINVDTAAEIVGCTTVTIIRWCKKGYLDHEVARVGLKNRYRVDKSSLLKYWEVRKKDFE